MIECWVIKWYKKPQCQQRRQIFKHLSSPYTPTSTKFPLASTYCFLQDSSIVNKLLRLTHHLQIRSYSTWHSGHLHPSHYGIISGALGERAVNQTMYKVHGVWWQCLVFLCPEAYGAPAAHIETGVGLRAIHSQWGVLQTGINHDQSNQSPSFTLKASCVLHTFSKVKEICSEWLPKRANRFRFTYLKTWQDKYWTALLYFIYMW